MNQSGLPCIDLSLILLFREFWDSRPSGATKVMARNGMALWANRIRSWQTWKASKAGYAVDALRFDRLVSNLFKLSTVFWSHQCRDNWRGNQDVFCVDFLL